MASIMEGRKGRGKFGSKKLKMDEFASTTNKEKARRKNPGMLKHRSATLAKSFMSMREKQVRPCFYSSAIICLIPCVQMRRQKSIAKDKRNR